MRLFGYRITGVSLKFFILLGLLVVVVVAFLSLRPTSAPPPNLLYEPAFSPQQVEQGTAQPGWLGPYEAARQLRRPVSAADFTAQNFAASVGLPMQLELYIPDWKQNSVYQPYTLTSLGKTFLPAYFINPGQATTLEELDGAATDVTNPSFVMVGFPSGSLPVPQQAYALKALLWWRSDRLVATQTRQPPQQPASVPVFLADGLDALQPAQLRAPATHSLDLELRYREDNQELIVHRIEWSSGREVRVLITLTNLTSVEVSVWQGIQETSASLAESASVRAEPDPESALSQAANLDAKQEITGYLLFPAEVANPMSELTLRLPGLSPDTQENDLIIITVDPKRVVALDTSA